MDRFDVALGSIWVGEALMLSTSQGLKLFVPASKTTVSQPLAPGPPLHPHQLLVIVLLILMPLKPVPPPGALFPTMRELLMVMEESPSVVSKVSARIAPPVSPVPVE